MVYQPVVSLLSGAISYYEVLARPTPRILGGQSVEEWVSALEREGRVADLDMASLEHALTAARAFCTPCGRPLSVNISPSLLGHDRFVRRLLERFQALPDPGLIRLEITERETWPDGLPRNVRRLQAAGMEVALDDVGVGRHGCLRDIESVTPCHLKLDGSIIKSAQQGDAAALVLVRDCVALARHDGTSVVAEHLESRPGVVWARTMGIDYGQGFALGRPQRAPEAPETIHARHALAVPARRYRVAETPDLY